MDETMTARLRDYGIAAIRIIVGVVFFAHGYAKITDGLGVTAGYFGTDFGLPMPLVSASLATAAETLGGLALILGLGTRWAAIPLAFTMAVAVGVVHLGKGFFAPDGMEFPLMLMVASIGLALTGSGAFALESRLFRASAPALGAGAAGRASRGIA